MKPDVVNAWANSMSQLKTSLFSQVCNNFLTVVVKHFYLGIIVNYCLSKL